MPHDSPSSAAPVALPVSPAQAPGLLEAVLTILGYFVLQLGFGMAFKLLSDALARWFPDSVPDAPDRIIVVVMLTVVASAWLTIHVVVRRWGRLARSGGVLGLGFTEPAGRFIAMGTVLGIVAPLLGGLLTQWLAGDHAVSQTVSEIADKAHFGMRVALVPVAVFAGPLVEEVLFRGALLARLRHLMGDGWAIGLSGVLFGAVHLPDLDWLWYAVPNLVLVGIFCAWLRVRSGSIWPSYVAHAANNGLAVMAWFSASTGS